MPFFNCQNLPLLHFCNFFPILYASSYSLLFDMKNKKTIAKKPTAKTAVKPFSEKFLEEMKTAVLAEKSRLEKELEAFAKRSEHDSSDFETSFSEFGDELDANSHEIEEYTVNKPLELALENSLRDANKALDRIKKGQYGVCKYCKKQIEEKRLRARPTSNSCVECKKTINNEA